MKRTVKCVNCFRGCRMAVEEVAGRVVSIRGNGCPRGAAYARQEVQEPMKVAWGHVRIAGCPTPLSLQTSAPIPKDLIPACQDAMRDAILRRPVHVGQVVVADVLGLGVDVIAAEELL